MVHAAFVLLALLLMTFHPAAAQCLWDWKCPEDGPCQLAPLCRSTLATSPMTPPVADRVPTPAPEPILPLTDPYSTLSLDQEPAEQAGVHLR